MAIFNKMFKGEKETVGNKRRYADRRHERVQSKAEKFPPQVAAANMRRINRNVGMMLGPSKLFSDRESKEREFALFRRDEIKTGKQLGSGGFSNVYEIDAFDYTPSRERRQLSQRIQYTRQFYTDTAQRDNGESRYALKHLKPELMADPSKFQMAAADLAVEGQFLSRLDHPHIMKLRGWSSRGVESWADGSCDGYFLVLDRLHGTLDNKIDSWRQEEEKNRSRPVRRNKNEILSERVKFAYQVASAMEHLHEKRIIFRDLKPNNIGLDADGNAKLFDFGLAREIPDAKHQGDENEEFVMSGKIGTQRYMAPEVARSHDYNLKADVYSWACNFFEILTLEKPYAGFSKEMHKDLCCRRGFRPDIPEELPESIQILLELSWAQEISSRPTMKQVCESLRDILLELDSNNADALTIKERRKQSVMLELPPNFAATLKKAEPASKLGDLTLDTAPESVNENHRS